MGTLQGIAAREKTKAPMELLSETRIAFQTGVGSDSRGKIKGNRQVTVLSQEAWAAACADMGLQMPWTTRRANLLVSGIELAYNTGARLRIGTCELEITGELEPCSRMDAQYEGLTKTLQTNWRGGVCCRILQEGEIKLGDAVELIP
jgi:MOSC domain-containing protein YiiM